MKKLKINHDFGQWEFRIIEEAGGLDFEVDWDLFERLHDEAIGRVAREDVI